MSYKSYTLHWYAKKEMYLHKISMFTFTKNLFPGLLNLPNLGAPIRCAQNRYTTVQAGLKYPLPNSPKNLNF